jgi:hypothetical protein
MYANTTNGYRPHVSVQKDSKVLQAMNINGNYCRLIQSTTTTTEEWFGLSYDDAQSVCVASETSVLNGQTRNYLGGARISVSSGGASSWATIEGCWGTRVVSQLQRMGDTNLYHVSRTTDALDVTNNGGTMEKL